MSKGVNKVILIGSLGQDPEVRYMPQGGAVANLSVATNERYKDKNTGEAKEVTEWHRVVIYQRLAEIAGEYLRKGSKVYIEGKLKTRKWQDKDGIERYTTEIIANELQMLDGKPDGAAPAQRQAADPNGKPPQGRHAQSSGYGGATTKQAYQQPAQQRGPMEPPIDFDDDIPF